MFTGLVEQMAEVVSVETPANAMTRLTLKPQTLWKVAVGDSIAVNGCCLTVTEDSKEHLWAFDVSRESLARTNLNYVKAGDHLNLERPITLDRGLDGHIVSGHVDTVVDVVSLDKEPSGALLRVSVSRSYAELVIDKGSICLNGVSLTINTVEDTPEHSILSLMLIPTTLEKTNLNGLTSGAKLNAEFDLVGKYILRRQDLER